MPALAPVTIATLPLHRSITFFIIEIQVFIRFDSVQLYDSRLAEHK